MNKEDNTKHFKQIFEALRKEKKLKKGLEKAQIKHLWSKLMSNTIARYTSDIVFDKGVLTVYLTSSALREELNRGKDKIIDLLNTHFGEPIVKKIIFK
jgi:predicted nucleic acid-binding Zn ribbon protein